MIWSQNAVDSVGEILAGSGHGKRSSKFTGKPTILIGRENELFLRCTAVGDHAHSHVLDDRAAV